MPLEMISERDFPQFTELEALHDFLKCFKKHAPREETCSEGRNMHRGAALRRTDLLWLARSKGLGPRLIPSNSHPFGWGRPQWEWNLGGPSNAPTP